MNGLGPEITAAGKAVGLLGADGSLQASWFENPLDGLTTILSDPAQRQALFDLLDTLFAPEQTPAAPANEKWHPLLGTQPSGNVYLTVADGTGPTTVGIAGSIHNTSTALPASLSAHLPLVSIDGGSVSAIAGTAAGAFHIDLRVELNWSISGGQAIALKAIDVTASLSPLASPPASLAIVLEGFSVDGRAPRDTVLDPDALDADSLQLVIGLLKEKLRQIAATATGEAASVANHLLPLLGLADGFPPFPFATVTSDGTALRHWLAAMAAQSKLPEWLGHLGALMGGAATAAGSGTTADPWRVRVAQIDASSELDVVARLTTDEHSSTTSLDLGLSAIYQPGGPDQVARIEAAATIASIPLQGTAAAAVLPSASLAVVAPGNPGNQLIAAPEITVTSLRAGAQWNGSAMAPLLEMIGVTLVVGPETTTYARLDLTNADSVVAAAADAVKSQIVAAIGATGAGSHLAAVAGLIPPAGDPGSPHTVDLAALVGHPTQAIAAVHRAALIDATHNWSFLFAEIAALLGLDSSVSGSGTQSDPWRVTAAAGSIAVELAAWNAQTSQVASDPQQLRLGLRASITATPWSACWLTELLAVDLPQNAVGTVALLAGHHASLVLQPVPAVPELAGLSMSADTVAASMDWTPGGAMSVRGDVTGLAVTSDGSTIHVSSITFPPPAGFDIANPTPALGISLADLETLFAKLFSRGLYSWTGMQGAGLSSLLGLNGQLAGLQADWPTLGTHIFSDPFGALREWFGRVAIGMSMDTSPFLPAGLAWAAALAGDRTFGTLDGPPPDSLSGSGTYEDPWILPLVTDLDLLAWLEPSGPPPAWIAQVSTALASIVDFRGLLNAVNGFSGLLPTAGEALAQRDLANLMTGLDAVSMWLGATDGFVPTESQVPTGGTWTAGSPIHASHVRQPSDPSAIQQITAQIASWNPGDRAVLLVGPGFSDHTIWNDLLASSTAPNFNFRASGVDPQSIDLTGVSSVADFYTADLQDEGLDSTTAQIARAVSRIGELRPGVTVTLVAHSSAGLAARAFTAANPSLVRGLITIGTPHAGTPLMVLSDAVVGNALRAVAELTPLLPAGAIHDAVESLIEAMDGYAPPAGPGLLPVARPFSTGAFAAPDTIDTAGVPALAIGGALAGDLLDAMKRALVTQAAAVAASASPVPTHIALGARAHLDFGDDGDVGVDVSVRGDGFRAALQAGAVEPARAARALTVSIVLSDSSDWLVGSPTADVRMRWAELGLTKTDQATTPFVRLHGAAFHSPTLPVVDLGHPQAQVLVGAVFQSIAAAGASAGPAVSSVLAALTALAVAAPDAHGGVGISADAWTAITTDPATYLAPRLNAALATGVAGFSGSGPFTRAIGDSPFEMYANGGTIGIRTTTAFGIGDFGSAHVDAALAVPGFAPSLDLTLALGAASLTYDQSKGTLTFSAPPWIDAVTLVPAPSAADVSGALNRAVPRLLLSSALSALIEAALGPDFSVGPLDRFFESPGNALVAADALGNGASLDGARITALLNAIASTMGLAPGPGLGLPGNLVITAAGSSPAQIHLSTTAPLGDVLDLQLTASIDSTFHVIPSGTASVHLALPGTWGNATIAFDVDTTGVSLSIAPTAAPPIQLLPTFSGLGSLAGAAAALLPAALDQLSDAIGPSTLRDAALAVADALDLHNAGGTFSAHADQWRALTQGNWLDSVNAGVQTAVVPAIRDVLGSIAGAGSVSTSGNAVTIGAGGAVSASVGWDSGPTVSLHTQALKAADGALSADVDLGFASGAIVVRVALGAHLQSSIGVALVPALEVTSDGASVSVKLLPLGTDHASALSIAIAPAPSITASSDMAVLLAEDVLLPIVTDLLVGAAKPSFGNAIWNGGPTVQELAQDCGLVTTTGDLAPTLPAIDAIMQGLLRGLATHAQLAIGSFTVKFVDDATGLGVNLRGSQDVALGSVGLTVRLENADISTANPGVTIYVFRKTSGALTFGPSVSVAGLGVAFTGPGGTPLIKNDSFRLEAAGGSLFFEFDGALHNLGGAVDAKGLGLPLGLLGGSHDGGNPVASNLLEGAGSAGGDSNPVNPAIDVIASYINGSFAIQFGAPNPPLWIGVHRSFGPIYIEQIGLDWTRDAAALLVDATVKIAGLTVQAYELSLNIGFKQLLEPEHWTLDLQGLAASFESGPVSIAGGLIKNPGPPIEYDGMLSAVIAGRGLTVVGGYARPLDAQGSFTSLFIFVSLPIPLGGPPFLFVTGLGGGAGYNRKLIPPADLNQLPDFFLISAIDDSTLANDPMSALRSMGTLVPPERGGYWLAAGVRFNSFVVVNTIAVVYVALDRGFKIGLLGVSRMLLPEPDIALVSIELALKARYSSSEGVLSIQGQLTDNSWLFSQDCQLTGGFAFFIWFPEGHFVLTIGGYHPAFKKPPELPDVPRLGFRWQVLGFVQIKGESYFAITSSAFMCGGRLEASAGFDGINAWFTAHLDVLIQWDPFHYDFVGGIQVGVSLRIEVCFFGACAGVSITISRGADIHIFGPPFHVDLTFDAYVTSITLSFGGDPHPEPDPLPWAPFRDKYLISGNPENTWVGTRVLSGVLVPDPPGAQPSPGTAADPLKLNPEFAFLTESRMPVSGYSVLTSGLDPQGALVQIPMKGLADAHTFDLAPMHTLNVGSVHAITFTPLLTHPAQFVVEEVRDLVPEAPWRWYDPTHLPAAANRISAITGLRITGVAILQGKSALIPIGTLVDDDPRFARSLPFAAVTPVVSVLQAFGSVAETLAGITAGANASRVYVAATRVLAGDGFFAAARASTGLPAAGLTPLATRTLTKRRSAPPLLTPLTTGLSMKPVALPAPPAFSRPGPLATVPLEGPRLRAVLQSRPLPTVDAPPTARTTVTSAAFAQVPRMQPKRPPAITGARFERIPAANAPRATRFSASTRTLRSPDVSLSAAAHSGNFDAAAKAIVGDGVIVPVGTTHVWDVPGAFTLELTGRAVVRVTVMNRAGQILIDRETAVVDRTVLVVPAGTESVAVTCLGDLPPGSDALAAGFGAISAAIAGAGDVPAVGWQAGNRLPQVGPSTLLARGAVVVLRKPYAGAHNDQRASQLMTNVSSAVAGQSGVETWLPTSTGVVMITLDRSDATAADAGDLTIGCTGATLAVPPIAGAGGNRRALLYEVRSTDPKADHIAVTAASRTGWSLAGVIGLRGRAAEWSARLHGNVPPQLVPESTFTPGGQIRVRLVRSSGGDV